MSSKIVALMGPPGSGKTVMSTMTSEAPVHVVDIDRKVRSMSLLSDKIAKGEITYKEISETLFEDSLAKRLDSLVQDKRSDKVPKGWTIFANYIGQLENDVDAKAARTIVIDSYTQLAPHLRAHIQHLSGHGKFKWDQWSVWKNIWSEITVALIDYAMSADKNLIINLHERVSEVPGADTRKVLVSFPGGMRQKEYSGTMSVKIAGSIEGAFGLDFGTYFTDVYALRVDVSDKNKPKWICRVLPDGQRDLRCSVEVKQPEFEPDFRKIWGADQGKGR